MRNKTIKTIIDSTRGMGKWRKVSMNKQWKRKLKSAEVNGHERPGENRIVKMQVCSDRCGANEEISVTLQGFHESTHAKPKILVKNQLLIACTNT